MAASDGVTAGPVEDAAIQSGADERPASPATVGAAPAAGRGSVAPGSAAVAELSAEVKHG